MSKKTVVIEKWRGVRYTLRGIVRDHRARLRRRLILSDPRSAAGVMH
jgi:hypothetical protein